MCGRYLLHADPELVARAFGLEFSQTGRELGPGALRPRYSIAPSQHVPIVCNRAEGPKLAVIRRAGGTAERELVVARWGLIPGWAKDPAVGNRLINARAEGLAQKPAFRLRRCVVPASGFYEWRRQGKGPKQPFLIRRQDGQPMGLAGLWELWTDRATGEVVTTCTIITCAPNELMAELHDRMPVVLDPADYDVWLDPGDPRGAELLRPCPAAWLEATPISTRVNSPANDDEGLVEPEGEELIAQGNVI